MDAFWWSFRGAAGEIFRVALLTAVVGTARGATPEASPGEGQAVLRHTAGITPPPAQIKVQGAATAGSRIRLRVDASNQPGRHYLWFQTSGPPVDLSGRTEPELRVTVPTGADELGFLLVVGDAQGMSEANVTVPVVSPVAEAGAAGGEAGGTGPTADAGDDQIGLVGRRITLNASGSMPRDGLDYRWIQVGGPKVAAEVEAGKFLSFIPKESGRYRFALVVAHQNRISEPDYVDVEVGGAPGAALAAPAARSTASTAAGREPDELDLLVGSVFAGLDDAPSLARPLAETFEATASRLDLYRTCAELFGELTRRLDALVPKEPVRRARWNAALFEPLTHRIVAQLLPLGLDLRTPQGLATPLSDGQKQVVREQLQQLARKLDSARLPR